MHIHGYAVVLATLSLSACLLAARVWIYLLKIHLQQACKMRALDESFMVLFLVSIVSICAYMPWTSRGLHSTACGGSPTRFGNQESYLEYLKGISDLPQGFSVGTARFNFRPYEVDKTLPMNLTLIMTEKPTDSFAAMFTSNKFPGGPIIVGKERIKSSPFLQAVAINNKISNVCPGGSTDYGAGDSDQVCQAVADQLGLPSKTLVFPSSTGIIGWRLPVDAIKAGVPIAAKNMQSKSIYPAAVGITTTDRYPKVRSMSGGGKAWSIVAIAKGAGMIGKVLKKL